MNSGKGHLFSTLGASLFKSEPGHSKAGFAGSCLRPITYCVERSSELITYETRILEPKEQ